MLKISKKLGALIITGAILASTLTGCGGGTSSSSSQDSSSKDESSTAESSSSAIDTSKAVEINWYHLGDAPTNGQIDKVKAEWDKILKEKVNATLNIKFIEWTDYLTKYNLLLASGEPIDMINTASDWLDMWPNAQKGAFKDITKMLPVYAPITYNEIPQEDWENCKYQGKIITIPENAYTQWVNHGFMYRGDWAEEVGITEPIHSWDQMEVYLEKVKEAKNIVPFDTAGSLFAELADGYMGSYTDSIMLEVPTNMFYSKSYEDIGTAYSPFMDEELMVGYANKMKTWDEKGFWRADVLNYKGDLREALKAGKTAVDKHHTQTYGGLRVEMDEKQPGSNLQFFDMNSQGKKNLTRMSITHGAQSVAAASPNPERALMVYDIIRNDETAYRLMNYGLEGVQYELKDEKRTLPEGYDETRDVYASNFWGGRVDKFEIPSDRTWSELPTLFAEFDTYAQDYAYNGFVFDKTKVDSYISAVNDVKSRHLPAIAFGKVKDATKAVQDFQSDLKKAGIDKIIEEIQAQLDAWKA